MSFDFDKIRNILACPHCRSSLVRDEDRLVCTNVESRLSFPILDEIPRLLVDEATELSVEDWTEIMKRHGQSP